jgi:exopolyphosphatase/guanosine-5'-triphosphate,3'-diphosphate pyrophosphatase
MRLGVLDVGSNTVHLLVVDAHRGAHPMPAYSEKWMLRLAELVDRNGKLSARGERSLVDAVAVARKSAETLGCEEMIGFATSAVRDASNSARVLAKVKEETGVALGVLTGEDEAALTFLAVRRWYGWSAGRLLCLDIGGGSLEISSGMDEVPDIALSLPLGAGRLTRERLDGNPPPRGAVQRLREYVDAEITAIAGPLRSAGRPDRVAVTSKTFRSLARLTGAAPSSKGLRVRRVLTASGLRQVTAFVSRMSSADLAELDGVSPGRSHQLLAGAVVAESALRALRLEEVDVCPWALREGVILRRLDVI